MAIHVDAGDGITYDVSFDNLDKDVRRAAPPSRTSKHSHPTSPQTGYEGRASRSCSRRGAREARHNTAW